MLVTSIVLSFIIMAYYMLMSFIFALFTTLMSLNLLINTSNSLVKLVFSMASTSFFLPKLI